MTQTLTPIREIIFTPYERKRIAEVIYHDSYNNYVEILFEELQYADAFEIRALDKDDETNVTDDKAHHFGVYLHYAPESGRTGCEWFADCKFKGSALMMIDTIRIVLQRAVPGILKWDVNKF